MVSLSIFKKVLLRCREKNIKLARHMLEFGTEVDFTRTHIGRLDEYWPTKVKINGILELPPPTNLTELRSFLSCWNELRHYVPDYQHSVDNMQNIIRKEVPSSGIIFYRQNLRESRQS